MAYDATEGMLEVVHRIPGRLRVRVPVRVPEVRLSEEIAALPGVTSATWSPLTRSLLVHYDGERAEEGAIVTAIARHAQVDVISPAEPTSNGERPTVAATVSSLFAAIDGRVAGATGGALALGVLVPAVLTLWAARELLRGRARPLAWSSALWYAHSLFRDYALPARKG
jgi:hypothetical protein